MPAAVVSAAAARAVASQSAGSKAPASARGMGKTVRKPWMTSRAKKSGMPRRVSSTAIRCALADGVAAPEVEEAADAPRADVGVDVGRDDGAGDGVVGGEDRELAELLGEGHARDEGLGAAGARG